MAFLTSSKVGSGLSERLPMSALAKVSPLK
jgi:hypothetical protein